MTETKYEPRYGWKFKKILTLAEREHPAEAYELAHEYDALVNLGSNEGDSISPGMISIENDLGENAWKECMAARCNVIGLFG